MRFIILSNIILLFSIKLYAYGSKFPCLNPTNEIKRRPKIYFYSGVNGSQTLESVNLTNGSLGIHLGRGIELSKSFDFINELGYMHAFGNKTSSGKYPNVEQLYLHVGPKYKLDDNFYISLTAGVHATIRHYILIDNVGEALNTCLLRFGYKNKLHHSKSALETSLFIGHFGAHRYNLNFLGLSLGLRL